MVLLLEVLGTQECNYLLSIPRRWQDNNSIVIIKEDQKKNYPNPKVGVNISISLWMTVMDT